MERYWHILWAACGILVIAFIFVIVTLFKGDRIIYTDTTASIPTEPRVTDASPMKGDLKNPLVTIVEYCHFGSTGCKTMAAELREVLKSFPEGVRVVWKDFPNTSISPESLPAALAARCANDQGKFWEFHDALLSSQTRLGSDLYTSIAKDLGLKENAFASCMEKERGLPLVQADSAEAIALQIVGTPTLYIDDVRIGGTVKTSELITRVQQALLTASTSTP